MNEPGRRWDGSRTLQPKPAANHRPPLAHAPNHDGLARLTAKVFGYEIRRHRYRVAVQGHDRSGRDAVGQHLWKGVGGLRRRGWGASQSERTETPKYGRTTNALHLDNHCENAFESRWVLALKLAVVVAISRSGAAAVQRALPAAEMSAPLWTAAFLRYDNVRIGFGLRAGAFCYQLNTLRAAKIGLTSFNRVGNAPRGIRA